MKAQNFLKSNHHGPVVQSRNGLKMAKIAYPVDTCKFNSVDLFKRVVKTTR